MLVNNQSDALNVELFKCIYTSAIPTMINYLFKLMDQNQIINEVLSFLFAVLDVRGQVEFNEFLNQCFTQKFSIFNDKIKQLSEAFQTKDLKLLKSLFKEIKQMHQQVKSVR